MASLDCPSCSSSNTQSLSVIFQQGISAVNTTTTGVGFAGGRIGVGAATNSGTAQTAASIAATPPVKHSWIWTGVQIGAFFLIAVVLGNVYGHIGVFKFIAYTLSALLIYRRYTHNRAVPEAMRRWQSGFQCLRCGNRFEVAA